MTRKLLSIAALAAITATSVSAFDTDMNGRLLKQEGTKRIVGNYTFTNNIAADKDLQAGLAGLPGDALVYPAFFSDKGWETEFSVINTKDEAMVAKVVFYSRDNSKELKDFNIYLSGHDVFRATVKENKLIITDSSFVQQSKTPEKKTNLGYTYTDTAKQASKANPVETTLPEGAGYIVVYGMVQADEEATVGSLQVNGEDITAYHKNHDKLWRDYRHLVDECRGELWRGGIQEGIYNKAGLNTPNIDLNVTACNQIRTTIPNSNNDDIIKFKSPAAQLIGSVTLKADDSRGTRVLSLNAVPLLNFSDDTVKQGLLWTEGEFASIADRRIVEAAATSNAKATGSAAMYDGANILVDSRAFNAAGKYTYEYGSSTANAFVLTQPHKRTLVQLVEDQTATGQDINCKGDSGVTRNMLSWKGIKRTNTGGKKCLITNYGAFDVSRELYDDNENLQTAAAGGFTFSPATVSTTTNTAPGEVTTIKNIVSDDDRADGFTSGYATITIPVPGIATQMRATDVGGNAETSWIYSGSVAN